MGDGLTARTAPGPRGLLRGAIKLLDTPLRRLHGVFEYSSSDDCLLRIAVEPAEGTIRYADGVTIERGEPVITLHFWNEHLPLMPEDGPTMAWANRFRRQLNLSLAELACRVQSDPRLARVKGVRALLASASPGHRQTVKRFGAHFGLQILATDAPTPLNRRLGGMMDKLWAWMLAWAFNPPALRGRDFTKAREQIGMSRAALIATFAEVAPSSSAIILAVAPPPVAAKPRRLRDPARSPAHWEPASP